MSSPWPGLLQLANRWRPADAHGTRLSGRWLVRARVVWGILAGVMLVLYTGILPDYWAQLRTVCAAVCRRGSTGRSTAASTTPA